MQALIKLVRLLDFGLPSSLVALFPSPKGPDFLAAPTNRQQQPGLQTLCENLVFPTGHQRSHYEQSQNMVRLSALISRLSRVSLYLGHSWRCAPLPQDLGPLQRSICLVSWRWLCPRPSGHPEPPGGGASSPEKPPPFAPGWHLVLVVLCALR